MSVKGRGYVVGVVGATGAVGIEIVDCLKDRNFPASELRLFSSAKSCGTIISTQLGDVIVEKYTLERARSCHYVFLAVSGEFALANARSLSAGNGPVVIDNSSAFRYEEDIPLVVSKTNIMAVRSVCLISFIATDPRNQFPHTEWRRQADIEPELYYSHCRGCTAAYYQRVWDQEAHYVHIPGSQRGWRRGSWLYAQFSLSFLSPQMSTSPISRLGYGGAHQWHHFEIKWRRTQSLRLCASVTVQFDPSY